VTAALPCMLLVEPQFVLRRTLVAVGRDLAIVAFHEAANLERARTLLLAQAYRGLVLDFQDSERALALLRELREGRFATAADARVVVIAAALQPEDEDHLRRLGVSETLGRPFKIGQLLERLAGIGDPQSAVATGLAVAS
jgi:DNA-binding response OmpR family regulator